MVGEHCETEKFTTTMRERSHECRWTRPRSEGKQGRSQAIRCSLALYPATRKFPHISESDGQKSVVLTLVENKAVAKVRQTALMASFLKSRLSFIAPASSEQRMQPERAIDFHLLDVITREHGAIASSKLGETWLEQASSGFRRQARSLTYQKWKKQSARCAGSSMPKTQDLAVQIAKNRCIFHPSRVFEGFCTKRSGGGGRGGIFGLGSSFRESKMNLGMRGVSLFNTSPHLKHPYESWMSRFNGEHLWR